MSKFLNLNFRDLVKGAVIAALAVIVAALSASLEAGSLPTIEQWKGIGWSGLMAFAAYLLKNLFTNSNDELLQPEKPYAEID